MVTLSQSWRLHQVRSSTKLGPMLWLSLLPQRKTQHWASPHVLPFPFWLLTGWFGLGRESRLSTQKQCEGMR